MVLPMGVDSDARASDYMPAWLALLPVNEWARVSSHERHVDARGHYLVSGYRIVNELIQKLPGAMPDLVAAIERLRVASVLARPNLF